MAKAHHISYQQQHMEKAMELSPTPAVLTLCHCQLVAQHSAHTTQHHKHRQRSFLPNGHVLERQW